MYNNEGNYYVVDQDQVFLAPMMSSMNLVVNASSSNGGYTKAYTLVAAVCIFSLFSFFFLANADIIDVLGPRRYQPFQGIL